MRRAATILASIFFLIPGCGLYSGGHSGGPDGGPGPLPDAAVCAYGKNPPAYSIRNPETGQCETITTCDPSCAPCPVVNGGAASPPSNGVDIPSWGLCTSQCTGLGEKTCLATSGCRAAYIDTGESLTPSGDTQTKQYDGCWATDMSGPVEGGGCGGLDAYDCSRHDDCIAIHASTCGPGTQPNPDACLGDFESCAAEPPATATCTTDADCNGGYHCDTSKCLPPPNCPPNAFCTTCGGTCVPDSNPGSCYGDVTCTQPEPVCPTGTVPGILNGCYTGYCIPTDQCGPPPPPPACDTLTDEATCIGRSDCTPIYQGQDCTCDASGACTCQTWVFASCQSSNTAPPPLPPPTPAPDGGVTSGALDGGSAPAL